MKQLSLAALVLAALSLVPAAGAQTPPPLMTVDAVNVGLAPGTIKIEVTGVVEGASSPTVRSATFGVSPTVLDQLVFEACHRSLLLALAKPGQYLARVGSNVCTVSLIAP